MIFLDRIRELAGVAGARHIARQVLEELAPGVRARLARVSITARAAPTAEDYERGATDDHRGYFWGSQLRRIETTELPDERPPEGEIVIFTDRIRPLSRVEIARTVLHEIAHVLGYEEHEIVHDLELG